MKGWIVGWTSTYIALGLEIGTWQSFELEIESLLIVINLLSNTFITVFATNICKTFGRYKCVRIKLWRHICCKGIVSASWLWSLIKAPGLYRTIFTLWRINSFGTFVLTFVQNARQWRRPSRPRGRSGRGHWALRWDHLGTKPGDPKCSDKE